MKRRFRALERASRATLKRRERRASDIADKIGHIEEVLNEGLPCSISLSGCPGLKWVRVPSGQFSMGSLHGDSDEQPVHSVTVKSFRLSESEVTVRHYRRCVEAGACTEPERGSYCNWGKKRRDKHPVNCVDWGQARTFSRWVGGDLPTESQWEYAARAGSDYDYAGSHTPDEVGWYRANSRGHTHAIKKKAHNTYGIYDMSGNLWEWVLDEYKADYHEASSRGELSVGRRPPCTPQCKHGLSRRVIRGGAWIYQARYLRVSGRSAHEAHLRDHSIGFRPARAD